MKTYAFMIAGVLITSVAMAQETVITSAPTIEMAVKTSASDLNATLTQLLNEAQTQNEKLQTTLDRMGDPSSVNLASIQIIKDDILDSATALKTRDEQRAMMTGLTGAEVFDNDAFGLMEPIGSTVTKDDGTVVERDPEKYRMDAAVQAQVEEFNNVREKALQRKKLLMNEIKEVTQDMQDATDLATIQKLQGMITVLYGQVDECNQSIQIAKADADMTDKELVGQARVMAKAKTEEKTLQRKTPDPDAPASSFPGLGGTPRKLPWGALGSTGNPGSATPPAETTDP